MGATVETTYEDVDEPNKLQRLVETIGRFKTSGKCRVLVFMTHKEVESVREKLDAKNQHPHEEVDEVLLDNDDEEDDEWEFPSAESSSEYININSEEREMSVEVQEFQR